MKATASEKKHVCCYCLCRFAARNPSAAAGGLRPKLSPCYEKRQKAYVPSIAGRRGMFKEAYAPPELYPTRGCIVVLGDALAALGDALIVLGDVMPVRRNATRAVVGPSIRKLPINVSVVSAKPRR